MPLSDLWLDSLSPARLRAVARYAQGPVRTGHVIFDRRANGEDGIHKGNAITALQVSNFVRPRAQVVCNGFSFPPGALRDHDMGRFRASMPIEVQRDIAAMTEEREAIVYQFGHYVGNTRRLHGWLCTDVHGRLRKSWPDPHPVSARILAEVTRHVSWSDLDMTDPVDAAGLVEAAAGMDAGKVQNFVAAQGWAMSRDRAGLGRVLPHAFREERPFSAWDPADPADTLQRAENPARLAALVAARLEMRPEALGEAPRAAANAAPAAIFEEDRLEL